MSTSGLRCIRCDAPLRVNWGRWLPFCADCFPDLRFIGEWDGSVVCAYCGKSLDDSGHPFLCSGCKGRGLPAHEEPLFCPWCRQERTVRTLLEDLETTTLDSFVVKSPVLFLCDRCRHLDIDSLASLNQATLADRSERLEHLSSPSALPLTQDFCLLSRLRQMAAQHDKEDWGRFVSPGDARMTEEAIANGNLSPGERRMIEEVIQGRVGWRQFFLPREVRVIEGLIASDEINCSDSLLSEELRPLPHHVCVHTLMESCAREHPLFSRPHARLDGDPVEAFATYTSEYQAFVEAANRVTDRDPSWATGEGPVWPIPLSPNELLGLVVRRSCGGGSVKLRGYLAVLADGEVQGGGNESAKIFADARMQIDLSDSDSLESVQKLAAELKQWYRRHVLDEPVRSRPTGTGTWASASECEAAVRVAVADWWRTGTRQEPAQEDIARKLHLSPRAFKGHLAQFGLSGDRWRELRRRPT